jgi:hypothetical protein
LGKKVKREELKSAPLRSISYRVKTMAPISESKEHLKYVFLGEKLMLPAINIGNALTSLKEEKLMSVLKENIRHFGGTYQA